MRLQRNADAIRQACDAGLLSGAVTLVWRRGELLQVNEIGCRDVEARTPMTRDTVFRIASMTKPVTVAAAMTFVEQGRLRLADPITAWLPEFDGVRVMTNPDSLDPTVPARRPITVEDLMTHRSGLAYQFSVTGPLSRAYAKLPLRQDQDRWLAELARLPLVHQPGEQLTYSHSTDVLGILLSRLAGRPLHEVLDERVLGPLGMADTGFFLTREARGRAATMYTLGGDGLRAVMGPPPIAPPPFCAGGAGLWSTAEDYLRFARMLLGDGQLDGVRVLTPESVTAMRTDRLTPDQQKAPFLGSPYWVGRGFGLNLAVVTDPARSASLFGPAGAGSFGWPGVYGTWWQADPEHELILIYLVQNSPNTSPDAASVAGNTSLAALRTAQPKFVRNSYAALDL
ncbi:serine hydrolase domain-containing protein [Mycolicibacterium brumae]|uniref:Beta-lactamase-related domain-containing protein n=1 Tax=Mycolicibacterium brumae TaxID=85968 RepID=A0A2G5PCY7_9MYCO|nr:serine hydrolase domain-containing protein [Mycolicibacterium brumae]MCV7193609.1 beta-lactamase family protein [Mycolicibacterium brumae]PIB76178.1 hypothetical protein CQY22_007325 [Mycolicibacterium brumae]RWA17308.1 hypothetical protein MBRU_06700 [Mycolicibacterium brumae DSM 44177]UWW09118.1 beta-lactamase family protein [Mycolicibacterium brumae]